MSQFRRINYKVFAFPPTGSLLWVEYQLAEGRVLLSHTKGFVTVIAETRT